MTTVARYMMIRKWYWLLLFVLGVVVLCFPLTSRAALSQISNDCPIVASNLNNNNNDIVLKGFGIQEHLTDLYSPEAIVLALKNLQWACCKANLLKGRICRNAPKKVLTSLSLFNHLADTAMRIMDGISVHGDESLVDEQGKAWRTYIREIAAKPQGVNPLQVEQHMREVRWSANQASPIISTRDSVEDCQRIEAAELTTLRSKYLVQCDLAFCLYNDMLSATYSAGVIAAW